MMRMFLAFVGDAVCYWIALVTSPLAWFLCITDLSITSFFIGAAVVSCSIVAYSSATSLD